MAWAAGGRNKLPPPLPIRASAPAAETIARATTLQKPIEPSETPAAAEVKKAYIRSVHSGDEAMR